MTATRGGTEWLIEANVLYMGNATAAVRSALGQLYSYRHSLYSIDHPPRLMALFSEPIGGAFVAFLESVGVASVWRDQGSWLGSSIAVVEDLAEA